MIRGVPVSRLAAASVEGLQSGRKPPIPVVLGGRPPDDGVEPVGAAPDGKVVDCPGLGAGVGLVPLGILLAPASVVPGVPTLDGKLKD
jgi:hypothetical protein